MDGPLKFDGERRRDKKSVSTGDGTREKGEARREEVQFQGIFVTARYAGRRDTKQGSLAPEESL